MYVRYYDSFADERLENGIVIFPDGAVMITDGFDKNGYMMNGLFYWLEGSLLDGMVVRGNYVEGDVVHTISKWHSIDLRAYHM